MFEVVQDQQRLAVAQEGQQLFPASFVVLVERYPNGFGNRGHNMLRGSQRRQRCEVTAVRKLLAQLGRGLDRQSASCQRLPVPVSVSSRQVGSSNRPAISSSSGRRPMNGVGGTGSGRRWAASGSGDAERTDSSKAGWPGVIGAHSELASLDSFVQR